MAEAHSFIAIHTKELEWQDDTTLFRLPQGVKVKVLSEDREMGRMDLLITFPSGYVEPRHTHDSYHSVVILEGRMRVGGYELGPGDYVYGWDEEHGPFEYLDGCTVFAVFHGASLAHQFEASGR